MESGGSHLQEREKSILKIILDKKRNIILHNGESRDRVGFEIYQADTSKYQVLKFYHLSLVLTSFCHASTS